MLCYITYVMLRYITYVMLCYVTNLQKRISPNFATHPSTETEWPPKLLTRFSSGRIELHNDMQKSL